MKLIEALKHYENGKNIETDGFSLIDWTLIVSSSNALIGVDQLLALLLKDVWSVKEEIEYFDFHRAIEELKKGNNVSRKHFENVFIKFISLSNYLISSPSVIVDDKTDIYPIDLDDMNATDWYVYNA